MFNCPYIEDVSSCFPYNLPTWVTFAIPIAIFGIIVCLFVLLCRLVKAEFQKFLDESQVCLCGRLLTSYS